MRRLLEAGLFPLLGVLTLTLSCNPDQDDPTPEPEKKAVTYKVVSHRGGYKESGAPECSIQGLNYSRIIGCYAAECDIVPTRDGKALVCHPDDNGKVNGLLPYEKTLAEIRAAGKLKNNEDVPIMEDFLDFLCNPEKNPNRMKIWIDTKAWSNLNYTVTAINAAYDAIKDRNAYEFCEFIIPQNNSLFKMVRETDLFKEGKCKVGFMASASGGLLNPETLEDNMWHQVKYNAIFSDVAKYTPYDYLTAGKPLSIWCCGTESTEYTELIQKVLPFYKNKNFKAMFVNYPQAAIKKIKAAGLDTEQL